MKFKQRCSHCGASRVPEGQFCSQCGRSLKRGGWLVILGWTLSIATLLAVIFVGEDRVKSLEASEGAAPVRINPHRNMDPVKPSSKIKRGPVEMARIDDLIARGDINNGLLSEAVELLDQVLAANPNYLYGLRLKANLLSQMNENRRAIAAYDQYLSVFPKDPSARLSLGKVLVRNQQWDRAITELDMLITAYPEYRDAYLVLAQALTAKGDEERAMKLKTIAIESKGKSGKPPLVYHSRALSKTR